jgi:hypothetical protein
MSVPQNHLVGLYTPSPVSSPNEIATAKCTQTVGIPTFWMVLDGDHIMVFIGDAIGDFQGRVPQRGINNKTVLASCRSV